jgi:Transglutaminase-like superfamily.
MRNFILLFTCLSLLFGTSCSQQDHFISDAQQRADVEADLQNRIAQLPKGNLFGILDTELPLKEKEALQFLYAYMPLGDITDYSGEYFKTNVEQAFRAKNEMAWGNDIPEREFNHFVLPIRINNENLDDFRTLYYDEMKDRVKGMTLQDAVLEINHWCHEKANYKGSDSRTSSPMATIKTSWGRCGEESTFLVAALRTICIPARQVYTPRWAHCDDNHAWVEAYVDGKWHFLGACEPEPILDLGWFNAPATRCLLLHTRVFGRYYGPEEVIETTANHTEINVVHNYAETAKVIVNVMDETGNPIPNLKIDYKIYNYAEFCTVVSKASDEKGESWLTAGLGDMMVYASNEGKFGFEKISFGKTDTVNLILNKTEGLIDSLEIDFIPPKENVILPEVSPEMRALNDKRFAQEDSIRNAYIDSFVAGRQGVFDPNADADENEVNTIMEKTWGNYQTIKDFIQYATDKQQRNKAFRLLRVISDKDLRDVSLNVLTDHLDYTPEIENELYDAFIMNPRVSNEMIVPYKKTFAAYFSEEDKSIFRSDPQKLVNWVKSNIQLKDEMNVRQIPMFPTGVLRAMAADNHSRDIFFVSMARSLGIPSQIDPVTGNVMFHDGSKWINVNFATVEAKNAETGYLILNYSPIPSLPDPKYYTHFTIKKFNGTEFELLAYDAKDPGMDVGMPYSSFGTTELEKGYYVLTTGTRLADGSVLNKIIFFTINKGETTNVDLVMREPVDGIRIIGNFNAEDRFLPIGGAAEISLLQSSGRGFYILGILDQGSEPTTHAMQDISAMKNEFESWGRKINFIFNNEADYENFTKKNFNGLPTNITYGIDNGNMLGEITYAMKLKNKTLPIFIIANSNNEVVFVSQGYTIGLGEQMLKVVHNL